MVSESAISASGWLRLNTTAGRGLVLGTVLGSSMAILDGSIVNVALPHIGADLKAGISGLQWTVNAYLLPLAAFVLLGGALGDRYGRRRVFLLGVVWFATASALCGLAPSIGLLIGARTLQGMGSALLTPGALALIQSTRIRMTGRARSASGPGSPESPAPPRRCLAGTSSTRSTGAGSSSSTSRSAIITILVTMRCVPESSDSALRREPFDALGAVLCALGLGAVTFALVQDIRVAGHRRDRRARRVRMRGNAASAIR